MTYSVEIEIPRSGKWFRYFTKIASYDEAVRISCETDGTIHVKVTQDY